MKKEKLEHYAEVLAGHADRYWVTPLFFALFYIDSFVMFLPADSLLGTTVSLHPRHVKKWTIASCLGAALGLATGMFLAETVLREYILQLIAGDGFYHKVQEIIDHAQNYGYIELTIGVFTIVPSLIAGLAGVVMKLNPFVVYVIITSAKLLKILLTLWLVYTGSHYLKKLVKFYLKTSV